MVLVFELNNLNCGFDYIFVRLKRTFSFQHMPAHQRLSRIASWVVHLQFYATPLCIRSAMTLVKRNLVMRCACQTTLIWHRTYQSNPNLDSDQQ